MKGGKTKRKNPRKRLLEVWGKALGLIPDLKKVGAVPRIQKRPQNREALERQRAWGDPLGENLTLS